MRKVLLLAGTALGFAATPAVACDLEMMMGMGMPQRYNAFSAMAASHYTTSDDTTASSADASTTEQNLVAEQASIDAPNTDETPQNDPLGSPITR